MKQMIARLLIIMLLSIIGAMPAAATTHGDAERDPEAMRLLVKSAEAPLINYDMYIDQSIMGTIDQPVTTTMPSQMQQLSQVRGNDALITSTYSASVGPEIQSIQTRGIVQNGQAYYETPDGWVPVPTSPLAIDLKNPRDAIALDMVRTARLSDSGMIALEPFQEVIVTYDPSLFKQVANQFMPSPDQLPEGIEMTVDWQRLDSVITLDPVSGRILSQTIQSTVVIQAGPGSMKMQIEIQATIRIFPAFDSIDLPDMTMAQLPSDAVDALDWLRNDAGVLAPYRFDTSAAAVFFVQRLYRSGAVDVVVVDIYDDPTGENPPYSEVLMVVLPEDTDKRQAIFKLVDQEAINQGYDYGQTELVLWWE